MKTKDTPKQYVIYSRKSKFTGKGESIENQIELCRQYIAMHFGEDAAEKAAVQRGRARGASEARAHAASCRGGRAACGREDAEVGGQGHAVRRVAEKMREQRQAAPFLKSPLAGYEETFRRAVDGRTRKGRKIGVFVVRSFMRRIRNAWRNGRSEARA